MWKFLRRLCRRTEGGAAVEFGFVFPFCTILILGVTEYGLALLQYMNINNAAQVGANYAMLSGFNSTNIKSAVTSATGIPAGNITVGETCGCASGTSIISTSCGPPLPACGNGLTAGAYVTVTVNQAYASVAPGIPTTLTAAALVRVLQ
jgi:Flp pilus assembly protein TadG